MTVQSFFVKSTIGQDLIDSELATRRLKHIVSELPGKLHILELLVVLEEICQFQQDTSKALSVSYGAFKSMSSNVRVSEQLRSQFLRPEIYLKLPRDPVSQELPLSTLLSYICRCLTYEGLYCSIGSFSVGDPTAETLTSLDALEDWLYMMSSRLTQIKKMSEQFLPLWVFTAAHTIAFFHGRQQTTRIPYGVTGSEKVSTTSVRIPITDLLQTDTIRHLLELRNPYIEDMESNPFARIRAVRYYDSFTVFDSMRMDDTDPTVPPSETCCILGGGYMNPVFVHRLLGRYVGGPPMDYRRFLTFAIAWDNRRSSAGIGYFWPIFDVDNKGFITVDDVVPLVDGMVNLLQSLPNACGPQGGNAKKILLHEVHDILKSSNTGRFSKDQAMKSPQAFGTIVGLLGNTQAFVEYECREDTAHKQFIAKQVNDAKLSREKADTSRSAELIRLQRIIDNTWFENEQLPTAQFASFVEFLDHHEQIYGGQAMEPWLTQYYQWESQEAEKYLLMMDSQLGVSMDSDISPNITDGETIRSRE
jgi:hypothetical protein